MFYIPIGFGYRCQNSTMNSLSFMLLKTWRSVLIFDAVDGGDS